MYQDLDFCVYVKDPYENEYFHVPLSSKKEIHIEDQIFEMAASIKSVVVK